ncbi:MAG: SDR family oxidoreductase [Acidimicrobiia bacterium]
MTSPADFLAREVLVLGATGYVGGRLVSELLDAGHRVRVLTRSRGRAERYAWSDRVRSFTGDVLEPDTLAPALEGCDVAYYLVHSIGTAGDFATTEATAAGNVRDAADAAGLERIVYLGGMGRGDGLSAHLASRHRVGEILAAGSTPTTELRAAVIIGSGSISFEMLRYLTEVLPAMITPRWVRTKCQPIAIQDVLHYLTAVLDDPTDDDRVLEIGGPDVVSYAEMMQTYAEVAGLPRRIIVPVPLLSPRLSSRWVGLVTPLPARIAAPLIDSLRHEVVMTEHAIDALVPHQPLSFRASLELALRHTRAEAVDTRWTDAGFTPADAIPGDPDWAGGALFEDHQTVETACPPDALYRAFARIGGGHGYYVANWAWSVRGLADKLIGGPGLRRGRRHPVDLRPGESLDFWRVVDVEPGRQLVLEAEMKVPGKAWLTWRIEDADTPGRVRLQQVAFFAPKGLFGRLYWYTMLPFHWLIFRRMAHAIVDHGTHSSAAGRATATAS